MTISTLTWWWKDELWSFLWWVFFRICSELQQKITKIQLFPTTGTEKWGKRIQVHSWHPSPCDQAPPNQLKKRLNGKAPGTKFIRKLMSFILAIKPSYVCLISQVLQEPGQVHLPSRELPYTFQRNLWGAGLWHWPPSAACTWERAGRGSAAFPGLANASTASPDSQHQQDCYCPASACSHCSPHKNTQQTQEISRPEPELLHSTTEIHSELLACFCTTAEEVYTYKTIPKGALCKQQRT